MTDKRIINYLRNVLVHMWYGNYNIICLQCLSHYIYLICHIRNENICGLQYTPYDIITNVILCHIRYISSAEILGTKQILCDFI